MGFDGRRRAREPNAMQVTTIAIYCSPARDVVIMKVLMLLDKWIHREARRAARELERDHDAWDT